MDPGKHHPLAALLKCLSTLKKLSCFLSPLLQLHFNDKNVHSFRAEHGHCWDCTQTWQYTPFPTDCPEKAVAASIPASVQREPERSLGQPVLGVPTHARGWDWMIIKVPSTPNHNGIQDHQCGLLLLKNNTLLWESHSINKKICPTCSDVEEEVLHWSLQAHHWPFQNHAYVRIYSPPERYKYSKSQSISTKLLLFPNRPVESKHCCLLRQNNSLDSLGSIPMGRQQC